MQSGVMEGRDRAAGMAGEGSREEGGGGVEQLECCQTLFGASAVSGDRDGKKHAFSGSRRAPLRSAPRAPFADEIVY